MSLNKKPETSKPCGKHHHPAIGGHHMIHGSCLCKSIQFTIHGALRASRFCYCVHCTKYAGTSPASWAMAESATLEVHGQGDIQKFNSGRGLRCFCTTCGCPVWFESIEHAEIVAIPLGVLDDGDIPAPEMHIFTQSKPTWCRIHDDLPQHETYP
ncbi:GFA family protein [Sulfidibacter corallicola]